jgi:hypothetical protein
MIKVNRDTIFSPLGLFVMYILASGLAIMGFRLVYPGSPAPLICFNTSWRFIRGFLDYLSLFPALALASLVIPFGVRIQEYGKNSLHPAQFLQSLKMHIFAAIAASIIYGLLFSLALPAARNYEANLIFQGRLYQLAKERAQENAATGEWADTAQFIAICERIWSNGPEHAKLKTEAEIKIAEALMTPDQPPDFLPTAGDREPVSASEALLMAETALGDERYFDAHWLASLGSRLAKPGSPEEAAARRLAGMAWSGVNSLAPNTRETTAYTSYRLKREGHEALLGEEWVRSYYLFRELLSLTPNDPDALKYLALSESGLKQAAFFIDEMELALGRILTGAVFSFPFGSDRLVMRISSLSTSTDSAYGIGIETMAFDQEGLLLWSMEAPYAKILPVTLDSGPALTVLLRALDRMDKNERWEPKISGSGSGVPGNAEIVLPVSWDSFLLLSNVRRGLQALSPLELRAASENLGTCGYLPQVFEAELLERFVRPLFMLPFGIFSVAIGWRYRAIKRPRYMAIPMLGILPAVFHGAVLFSRSWFNNLGILALVSFGFNTAALLFATGITSLLILSLIMLAASRITAAL